MLTKQALYFCWSVAALLLLGACSKTEPYQQQAYVFGTLVEVSIVGVSEDRAQAASQAVLARFDDLHRQLHAWQPSDVTRINQAFALQRSATVDMELATLIRHGMALSSQSDHLFNPAIGGLIALWGFHSDVPSSKVPDATAIAKWRDASPRMSDIHLAEGHVWSDDPSVQLDFGGIAKGYALDEAARILRNHRIQNALINIGGNLIALGRRGENPWRVGIQHPRQPGMLGTLDLHDGEALGTSGDYQRFFEVDGKRYSHLIDPRTGYPADRMQSVTVLVSGPQAGLRSDALSKPLFIDGPERLAHNAAKMGVSSYLAVDARGKKHLSPSMAARLR